MLQDESKWTPEVCLSEIELHLKMSYSKSAQLLTGEEYASLVEALNLVNILIERGLASNMPSNDLKDAYMQKTAIITGMAKISLNLTASEMKYGLLDMLA